MLQGAPTLLDGLVHGAPMEQQVSTHTPGESGHAQASRAASLKDALYRGIYRACARRDHVTKSHTGFPFVSFLMQPARGGTTPPSSTASRPTTPSYCLKMVSGPLLETLPLPCTSRCLSCIVVQTSAPCLDADRTEENSHVCRLVVDLVLRSNFLRPVYSVGCRQSGSGTILRRSPSSGVIWASYQHGGDRG